MTVAEMAAASQTFKEMGEKMAKHAHVRMHELEQMDAEGQELPQALRLLSCQMLALEASTLMSRAEAVHSTAEVCSRLESIGDIMRAALEGAAKRIVMPDLKH